MSIQKKKNKKLLSQSCYLGKNCYLNGKCWLARNLNYSPYKRCQYCELKFHQCLFLQYQLISIILISGSFLLLFLIDKRISTLTIMVVFVLVIVFLSSL